MRDYFNEIFIIAALIVAGVSFSVGMTISHKLEPATKINELTPNYQIISTSPNNYTVYLTGNIMQSGKYTRLVMFLNSLTDRDIVKLYIQGNGGYMDTANILYDAIHNNPARIDIIVYGNVYSADALIALAGDTLTTRPHTLFLYHVPAVPYRFSPSIIENITMKEYCNLIEPGLDRGIDLKKKCLETIKWQEIQNNASTFSKVKDVLSEQQYKDMLEGNDVIIDGTQVIQNLGKGRGYCNNETKECTVVMHD